MRRRGTALRLWAFTGAVVFAIGAGCRRAAPAEEEELPEASVTSWTALTELFMEHPPLIAGQTVRFATHLTVLKDFSALNAGRPSIEMRGSDGRVATVPGSEPLRPGAFRIEGPMPAAGEYAWALLVRAPGLQDRHDLGTITVHPDEKAARAASAPESGSPTISYLKEQQWTRPFATIVAGAQPLRSSISAPARVTAVTAGDVIVPAPAPGRLAAGTLPALGADVRAGQVLARFQPRIAAVEDRATLVEQVIASKLALDAARTEQQRAERLLADMAAPARRVEEAKRAVAAAEARVQAAEARLAQGDETLNAGASGAGSNAFVLRAPISGRIVKISATPGATFEEGAELFHIVRTNPVAVVAMVSAADASGVRGITSLEFEPPGRPDPIPKPLRRMVNTGVIDPRSGALEVYVEVENASGELLVGQTGTAVLYTERRMEAIALPRAALLTESGRPIVFVQVEGESFEKRRVELGARDGDLVAVRAGVKAGERVVVRGTYDVLLASAARGLPAEGHVH